MKKNYYIIFLLSIVILVQSRLIPHPPNFTPILAVGIFSGYYFKKFYISFSLLIFSMFLGDLYIGLHSTMLFTYTALSIPILIGILIKNLKFKEILFSGLISALSFFLITNFGAWLILDIYEKNFYGLVNSYIMALPFFSNTLLSTFLFLMLFKFLYGFFIRKKILQK